MKRLSFLLFAFIFIGLYLFIYDPNSSFKEQEIKQTQFFSVIKPIWKIQIQNTKDSYELNSLKALQEENKEVFLLDEPIFKTYRDNKSKSSASSVSAVFDLGNELLIMTNNVHLTISEKNEKFDLFTKKLNFDFKKGSITSKNEIELKNSFLKLKGKGFELNQDKNGQSELTLTKVYFMQDNDTGSNLFGKADLIFYKSSSDIFTMIGSAQIKDEFSVINAEEIEFNFKTKNIVSSKKSKITKS